MDGKEDSEDRNKTLIVTLHHGRVKFKKTDLLYRTACGRECSPLAHLLYLGLLQKGGQIRSCVGIVASCCVCGALVCSLRLLLSCRGFGFVNYTDPSSVEKVLASGPHHIDAKRVRCLLLSLAC